MRHLDLSLLGHQMHAFLAGACLNCGDMPLPGGRDQLPADTFCAQAQANGGRPHKRHLGPQFGQARLVDHRWVASDFVGGQGIRIVRPCEVLGRKALTANRLLPGIDVSAES